MESIVKLRSFPHVEFHGAPYNEPAHIKHHIQNGIDLFDRAGHIFVWVESPQSLQRAQALHVHADQFLPLFLPGPAIA